MDPRDRAFVVEPVAPPPPSPLIEALVSLDRALWSEAGAAFAEAPWGAQEFEADRPGKWLLSRIARTDGLELVGYWIASMRGERWGHVHRVAVSPTWRRRGVGRALAIAATGAAWEHGIRTVTLFVQRQNVEALDFYRHLGFTPAPAGSVTGDSGAGDGPKAGAGELIRLRRELREEEH